MISGALVTAFDNIRQDHEESALHLIDLTGFFTYIRQVLHTFFRRLGIGPIQVFDLITGTDPQGFDTFYTGISLRR